MKPVAPADATSYGSLELPWRADEAMLISDPDELRGYLDDLPADRRRATEVVGELTNTVVAERVPHHLVVFRGGSSTEVVSGTNRSATSSQTPGRQIPDLRTPDPQTTTLVVDASRSLDALVADATAMGLHGVELMSGIPGTVGAAVVQNAGAYGQDISEVFVAADAYDRSSGEVVTLRPEDLRFSYRTSVLKTVPGYSPQLVLLRVQVALRRGRPDPIGYDELARHHTESGRDPDDLEARRASVLEVRSRKGMVVRGDNWRASAGSFFVGPRVSREVAVEIATQVRGPEFAQRFLDWYRPDGTSPRLPAALALRAAGFINGDHWGAVGLSDRHILALHNRGGATGTDVLAVSRLVRRTVHERLGIELEPEVKWLGAFPEIDLDAYEREHPLQRGEGEPEWARATGDAR